jgi:hypothetical protein
VFAERRQNVRFFELHEGTPFVVSRGCEVISAMETRGASLLA